MSFFRGLKQSLLLMKANVGRLIVFGILYTITAGSIMLLAFHYLFEASLVISGVNYIGRDTYKDYFTSPFSWIYIVLIILITASLIMVEIAGLIYIYDKSMHKEKVTIFGAFKAGIKSAFRTIKPKNIGLVIFIVLVLPFVGMAGFSNLSYSISIPGFIMDFFKRNAFLYIAVIAVFVFILIYVFRNIFVLHVFTIDECNFKEAKKKTRQVTKKKTIKVIVSIIVNSILLGLIFAGVGVLIAFIVRWAFSLGTEELTVGIQNITLRAIVFGISFVYPFFEVAHISELYYSCMEKENIESKEMQQEKPTKRFITVGIIIIVGCVGLFAAGLVPEIADTKPLKRPAIVAHRGDSVRAPENTMPAFKLALEEGVSSWVELDVHQTKDGVIIVSHDDSMALVSNTSKCVHEMTYAELMELDVGSWFSEKFKGLHVSTLEEVLNVLKGHVKVQIEIKPTEYDQRLPEQVVDLVKKLGMEDDVIITSLSPKPLQTIKEYSKDTITVFSMALAMGDLSKIPFADYVTIEEQNVTKDIVEKMHKKDKLVFAWTINSAENVQHLIDAGVDGILTDDPIMLNNALNDADYSSGIARVLRGFS